MAKRGRPRKEGARRRETTRALRRGERDRGSDRLRLQRIALTGREDLPVDPLGVLHGRDHLGQAQYHAGRDIGDLIEVVQRSLGVATGSVQGGWLAILSGGAIRGAAPVSGAASGALRLLDKLRDRIADPVMAEVTFAICAGEWRPCVMQVMRGRLTAYGRFELACLDQGLAIIARHWSKGA